MLQPFESAPTGFAVCRALFDGDHTPTDFALEEINPAFARLLRLKPEALADGAQAVAAQLFLASYDWLGFLCGAAIDARSVSQRLFVLAVGRYLQFDAWPCGPDRCLLQLSDITEDMFTIYKHNAMLTAVDAYILEYDGAYRCLSVFSADGRFLGRETDEYVGKTVRESLGPDYWPLFENAFAETRETREKVRIEFDAQTPEGVRWFGAEILSVSNLSGEERFYAVMEDVTGAVLSDRGLAEENSKLTIINKLVQQVNDRMSIEQVIREIVDTIYIYNAEFRVGFAMLHEDNMLQFLYTRAPEGMSDITGERFDMGLVPYYTDALRAHESFGADDLTKDPRITAMAERLGEMQSCAFLHMPMKYPGMAAGALTLASPRPHQWSVYETELLREIAAIMELAIEKSSAEENRKHADAVLGAEKERLRITLQCIGDGVIATDETGGITIINGVAEALTGWPAQQVLGQPASQVCPFFDESGAALDCPVCRALSTAQRALLSDSAVLRSRDGQHYAVSGSASPILDAAGAVIGAVLVFRDVTEAKQREREITYLSYHDALTGLYNRAFFDEEMRRLNTDRQLPISVVMGDVNGLKLANDVFGHAEGDRVLRTIARILTESTRSDDILARIGGDEFCILLPKTSSAAAQNICRRIQSKCREYALRSDVITPPSISMGVATREGHGEDIADTLKNAEQLMYKRKLLESKSVHNSILTTIRATLFEKSRETEEHTLRLAEHTRAMGLAMGLTEEQLNELELFSVLHDIGKIAVDDRILLKSGPLTDAEREEIRRHSETGYRVVRSSPEIAHVADLVLAHHEDWDGGGYPQGLSGTAIPLLARMLRVADAYDVMTHSQAYRPALTKDEALRELQRQAGKQFDPDIVRVFLGIMGGEEKKSS